MSITSTVQVSVSMDITAPTGCLASLNMALTNGFFTAPTYTGATIVGNGTTQTYTNEHGGERELFATENTARVHQYPVPSLRHRYGRAGLYLDYYSRINLYHGLYYRKLSALVAVMVLLGTVSALTEPTDDDRWVDLEPHRAGRYP